MVLLFAVLLLLFCGGTASLCMGRTARACTVASASCALACLLGFVFSLNLLLEGVTLSAALPITLPLGHCLFVADPVSAVFLLPVFLVAGIGSVLLPSRMRTIDGQPHLGRHGFFFCMLVAGMVLVLTAADGVFFLIAWEGMSLAPFFLLSAQDKDSQERFAGWAYLVAAHLGVLPLLLLFASMSMEAGGTAFSLFASFNGWENAGLLFALALLGFGVKIGLAPLHVWMPKVYPAAPGHVAAVLSGAMVNAGLYGIVRVLLLVGPPEIWWAYLLMAAGGISGVGGILFALAQPDMKRTLAYSSAENMGIICLALGAGLLALQTGATLAMVLFFAGALLHMWNHSLFKSLYFLGASAVSQSTGTTSINRLGGLQKRMPFAGSCMAVASASIAGVPPFNGFVGELLLYLGFVAGAIATRGTEATLVFWVGLFTLAGIAGLSLLCFTRLYGLVFLGAPRSSVVLDGRPASRSWRLAMATLAGLCIVTSLAAPYLFLSLEPALHTLVRALEKTPHLLDRRLFYEISQTLSYVSSGAMALIALAGLFALYRWKCVRRNSFETGLTWDCGYRFPSARMQYTGGGFAQFPAQVMRSFLRPKLETPRLDLRGEIFPRAASARFEATDWPESLWHTVLFRTVARLAESAKGLQHGLLNAYILYILIALLAALVWALGWS